MKHYLAKSDGETIVQHTCQLVANLDYLQSMYPTINVNWNLLRLACLHHDLGKMNDKFQKKVQQNRHAIEGELPHGLLSTGTLPNKKLKALGYLDDEIKILNYAVALHHERDMSDITSEDYHKELKEMKEAAADFPYALLGMEELAIKPVSKKYFKINTTLKPTTIDNYQDYVMLKGLLNRLDYAASAHIPVEHPNDFLADSLERLPYDWNDLQQYMLNHQNKNVVIIAQTGLGKTEAGLLWLGKDKGFFTLPLRTAINAIYQRISDQIVQTKHDERIGLLHADIYQQYLLYDEMHEGMMDVDEYETKTRQLSLPLTICTLDQLFDIAFRYPGYEQKLATLSYSKVIIDEIQMYSADLLAYLIYGLKLITDYGGKFAILTATLPPYILDLLDREGLSFERPETAFLDKDLLHRHQVEILSEEISIDQIVAHYQNNKVLVICNTVRKARDIYDELHEAIPSEELHLFHSQFIQKDRADKEQAILNFGDKYNTSHGIWVTTQVVEASLDVDFDLLFTELSDLNSLFQRMGRCYRKRPWQSGVGTNVYVYDGGDRLCSGVGYVVDKDVHELSKEALQGIKGRLDECMKVELINQTYTLENLNKTDFYTEVTQNLTYLKLLIEGQKNKKDVQKQFRNIHSYRIMPMPVYKANRVFIDQLIDTLKLRIHKDLSLCDKKKLRKEKRKARIMLEHYQVDIPSYLFEKGEWVSKKITPYETLTLFECDYDVDKGLSIINENSQKISNIF
ncbi:CRISPR-associated helicase Cas3' [Vagococcus lutrae]|uniref:CRISPR-associated helicase Cas3' n=1 Tax=Vagococcus lutrae TaxID=81947 RepID=UPI002A82024B|nr:CRISPR-associated helicase Cas3' [Vagococcus lutrae]MDY3705994.1 CRISPR-associated helicase Cas3' [Vagococcus lutrae]